MSTHVTPVHTRDPGEVVETGCARLAAVALPIRLRVVVPVPDHRIAAAPGTAHALRPAALAHEGEALGVVQQARKVNQIGCSHGGGDSSHERGQLPPLAPAHHASFAPRPGPDLTTPKPNKSEVQNVVACYRGDAPERSPGGNAVPCCVSERDRARVLLLAQHTTDAIAV